MTLEKNKEKRRNQKIARLHMRLRVLAGEYEWIAVRGGERCEDDLTRISRESNYVRNELEELEASDEASP